MKLLRWIALLLRIVLCALLLLFAAKNTELVTLHFYLDQSWQMPLVLLALLVVVGLLRSDPRLQALLPESGSPLIWSLLLRPAGAAAVPQEWLAAVLEPPLLKRLLARGWVPPLPAKRLAPALAAWSEPTARLLLPKPDVLARCNSLARFSEPERHQWQALWDRAAPQATSPAGA